MICSNCGRELEEGSKTCSNCEHWTGWNPNL